jgi:hypothetical protein
MKTEDRIEEVLWRRFRSEHRRLERVLDDVGSLIAAGSFETARKCFGQHRLAAERHQRAEDELLTVILGDGRESRKFVQRVRRERRGVVEQTERIWARLCRERLDHIPRMLARLKRLGAQHEEAERQLILGEFPLSATRRQAHRELVLHLG